MIAKPWYLCIGTGTMTPEEREAWYDRIAWAWAHKPEWAECVLVHSADWMPDIRRRGHLPYGSVTHSTASWILPGQVYWAALGRVEPAHGLAGCAELAIPEKEER